MKKKVRNIIFCPVRVEGVEANELPVFLFSFILVQEILNGFCRINEINQFCVCSVPFGLFSIPLQ